MRRTLAAFTLIVALYGCAAMPTPLEPRADAQLRAIYDAEWLWRKSLGPSEDVDPDEESEAGLTTWPRIDPASQAQRLAYWTDVITKLDRLDAKALSTDAAMNLAIFRQQIEVRLARIQFREYEKPVTADTMFWSTVANSVPKAFKDERDARAYVARLNDLPRYFFDEITNMRLGLARGFTPPRLTLAGRDVSISGVYENKTAEASSFYAPYKILPANLPAATRAAIQADAKSAIESAVFPAYRRLLTFFRDDYLPKTRSTLAATSLPDGQAYYRSLIREFATIDLTPDQIHQIGLDEMAKIRARMDGVIKETGFTGDFSAFLAYLRSDPQFYAKTPDELLMRASWIAKKFDGKASIWFGRLPRARFTIIPVPETVAPFYTSARGGNGYYLVNTYKLSGRPLYALPALTLHESAPGHAFQMPLAEEQPTVPEFRRSNYISAYGEGWALYCEVLGEEMGMYETPYDRFGMLSYQAWRAARLVIDTGVHAKGWTRQQAIDYLAANTALPEHEIETEVDRYISWPGQALSYYLGEMAILEARAKAEKALGAKFDIRHFHDVVLQLGSVPLPVLTAHIDRWIAEGGPDPYLTHK